MIQVLSRSISTLFFDLYGTIEQVGGVFMNYKPPYTISNEYLNLVAEIMETITKLTLIEIGDVNPKLRSN